MGWWQDLARVKVGKKMVNQFALHESIPNKWFEWDKDLNKKEIMVVGQDWGPYVALKKYMETYDPAKQWTETFSSRTEKFLLKEMASGFEKKYGRVMVEKDWQKVFFTVAVLFCRSGHLFRGSSNFEEKLGMELSLPFLKKQVEVVKPKVILCLGKLAQKQIAQIPGKFRVINSFHPAAHVDPKIIRESIEGVWD